MVRPGQLDALLNDLKLMFSEELDFRREATNTDIFRRRARRSRLRFITAPRVFFELSNDEVMVSELVSGIWLWEVLEAVEHGSEEARALMRRLRIDPVTVARRLFQASLFGIFENVIFHADPHPANVIVRRDGEIVLIDFGSCGSYTESQLHVLRHFHYCQANEDVGGMVQCILSLLEPLPPVDVDAMQREIEEVFAESILAFESQGSEWWQRTSAGVWIGFLRMARKYGLRVQLDVLRMVRSTLLYDTLAARLYPQLDIYREYRRYRRRMAKAARRRFNHRLRRLAERGLDDRVFLRLEELSDLSRRLTYRLERFADAPSHSFSLLAGKAVFAATSFLHWGAFSLMVWALGILGLGAARLAAGAEVAPVALAVEVVGSLPYLAVVVIFGLVQVRHVLFRFRDREVGG